MSIHVKIKALKSMLYSTCVVDVSVDTAETCLFLNTPLKTTDKRCH